MQISNPVFSQTISASVNRVQQMDRLDLKPVTIEGQLEDEKKSNGNTAQNYNEAQQSENTPAGPFITPASAAQATPAVSPDNFSSALLFQKQRNASFANNSTTSGVQSFPYGSRRSFAGLSGGSLIIQKYLNNESTPTAQQNSAGNIDLFI